MSDKYLSMREKINGFSFANLGIFSGFASSIISAVYSLILLDIFHNSATVGIYVSIYYAFALIIGLSSAEIFKRITKAKLFYACLLAAGILYFMMAFQIKPATFISLDFISLIPQILIGLLIPLFMADFSKDVGMEKLNGRYWLWVNIGALLAPMLAMTIADSFGIRTPFFAVSFMYIAGLFYFNRMKIIQQEKKIKTIDPNRTLRAVWRNTRLFFRRKAFVRAYLVLFGSYALVAMRVIYVPIIVVEQGFSKDILGLILTLGIIPYVILSEPLGRFAKKYGKKGFLLTGFLSFAVLSFCAVFAEGWSLLVIFVLWQISGALIEPLRDLLFFDAAKKEDRARFMGTFRTATSIPRFIAPLAGATMIFVFGATSAVWIISGLLALFTAVILLKK
ncbi:MAG: MFS transporter [Alphaproteobacteria bacterium]|nr:MFS transporter [Alphaproteobacteria bacterium]